MSGYDIEVYRYKRAFLKNGEIALFSEKWVVILWLLTCSHCDYLLVGVAIFPEKSIVIVYKNGFINDNGYYTD